MFDKMIEVGASWDWVTPLISFATCAMYGRVGIVGNIPPGWSAYTMCYYIKSQGVKTYHPMVIRGQICFDVDKANKDLAYNLLWSIGG